jgi:hypothetical protein
MAKRRARATTADDPIAEILAEAGDPARPAAARLLAAATDDPSDPSHAIRLPVLIIDAIAEHFGLPDGRCVTDCLILAHAYAQLGVAAQVRAAVLTVRDRAAGLGITYGSLIPEWEDGLLNGHAALWLPHDGLIVDANAEQYEEIADTGCGPVITPGEGIAGDRVTGRADFGSLSLRYTLAPRSATPVMLGHPAAHEADPGRRGPNIAANAVLLLARFIPETDAALIPHPRTAALVHAVRGMRRHDNERGDIRFHNPDDPAEATTLRLDQLPLPGTTPPSLPVET